MTAVMAIVSTINALHARLDQAQQELGAMITICSRAVVMSLEAMCVVAAAAIEAHLLVAQACNGVRRSPSD